MIIISSKKDCCGCTACEAICPYNAISMEVDALGFNYPKVNLDKCVDCHLCEKVCQFSSGYDKSTNIVPPSTYGVRHKNIDEVSTSRSGGAFVALANALLKKGAVIYGAVLKGNMSVGHIEATCSEELFLMKGSKYVQSDLSGVFREIKNSLKEGKKVLFSGTPCQTSGLRGYVGTKLIKNLYLIDIVCHGVPSPNIWRDNILFLQKKWNTKIKSANFRDKRFGWYVHRESYQTDKGLRLSNSFTRAFYKTLSIRESCENCPFANTVRPSDITLADFWGWEKVAPDWNKDDMGLSLVIVNSLKGKELFEEASEEIEYRQFDIEDCMQNQLRSPIKLSSESSKFKKEYEERGYEIAMRKYACIGLRYTVYSILSKLKRRIKLIFK